MPTEVGSGRFVPAARVQESLLAPLERRALNWLARHMPRVINSDHLTLLGLLAMIGAGVAYRLAAWRPAMLWVATLCLVLNWLGDDLDGTLARYRNQQRPRYGFYVDHMADVIGTLALLLGMGTSGLMHLWVAVAMLIAYYLLFAEAFLATYTLGSFRISVGLFSPTELRVLLAVGNTVAFFRPVSHLGKHQFLLFDAGCLCGAVGMVAIFLFMGVRHTVALYGQERIAR